MDNFQKEIDERTNLTSSNRFELLLFRLGTSPDDEQSELFGINVFKLREIVPMPTLTKAAGMVSPMMGMANIRGEIIPVIDLPAVVGCVPKTGLNILLVTEYARSTQAFAVESVDDIVRLEWSQVLAAEAGVKSRNITSIARLDSDKSSNRLALVLDVEQILHDIIPNSNINMDKKKTSAFKLKPGTVAIVAEDSKVARQMLEKGLNMMEIPAQMHVTGLEAWNKIRKMAEECKAQGLPISDKISFVLTDLEMPEMDGFTLTLNIKRDEFLKNIPVIIHSSLSGSANEDHVRKVGADGYVAKFEINELEAAIHKALDAKKIAHV
ncbi:MULTISPECIES: chemotaxis protein [Rahnella]|jgi:two-component system, chemotaxis family, chemotaxis protein CheV|uniref:Chemotaxis protein n=1 Tax=Rahnella sp. (strain Y9602) TaxID=2703885 RepID=A0A0H3F987_RAHSY|nr:MULTISPECIES: chemotaxis protein [Rahnella]AFE58067.1 response regulator receiver modulated CheW protein [Rahnella aquatilis HX2]AZP41926.1 chemotaxis protein CheV [Rahnella aquatilis]ADW73483.1 response regulator receiver modulated CheW protein [Rahnella aceris]AZP46267.1 chemotaxis protein CheV [Rahnella aquatilis]AZP50740.1 chemotaxis protein CheV [Rahnella aquatilis]